MPLHRAPGSQTPTGGDVIPTADTDERRRRDIVKHKFTDFVRKKGLSKKDAAWKIFEDCIQKNDELLALEYLDMYVKESKPSVTNFENFCFELFLDFVTGRKGIKNARYAAMIAEYIVNTRDVNKLAVIASFFEKIHEKERADTFYVSLYKLYLNGDSVRKDLNKAAEYIKNAIQIRNTPDRRDCLREIYEQQIAEVDDAQRLNRSYEMMIEAGIEHAKADYAKHLESGNKKEDAIRWLIDDGRDNYDSFRKAYELVNIKSKNSIEKAISEFNSYGGAATPFAKSLNAMRANPEAFHNFFNPQGKTMGYYWMTLFYSLFGPIFAMLRTVQNNGVIIFVTVLLGVIGLTAIGGFIVKFEVGAMCLLVSLMIWTFAALGYDYYLRKKFRDSCQLWVKLEPHPQLKDSELYFKESAQIINSRDLGIAPILPILAWLSFSIILGVGIMSPQTGANMPAIEQMIEQEAQSLEQTKPSAEDREAAIKVFERFYNSIANGDFRRAYACFSKDIQSQTTYDDWLPSAQKIVKSELRNETIVSATADEIGIQFKEHVQIDKDQAQDFEGVVVMKKEGSDWKIAGIETLEESEAEPAKSEPPKTEPPKTETPKAEQPKTEQPKTEQPKTETPKAEPPKAEEKLDDKAKAIKVLNIFHESITAKNYKQAYDCFSDSFKNRVPYDGWAPGFKTTVSSIAVDPKVTAESPDSITIEYTLRAVDDPGGVRNFNSSVVMVRTANGWKINTTNNKLK